MHGSLRRRWRVESVEARKGKQSKCEIEQKKGDGLFWYSTHLYANKTTCKRRVLITLGIWAPVMIEEGETVCPCAALHAFILACKRVADKKRKRASVETDSSQCLQQAQSSQANIYLHHAVPERRWHQSIPFWQGSWDNSWLWFLAITPANQNERHRDCRETTSVRRKAVLHATGVGLT